jgi:hypothetical protein
VVSERERGETFCTVGTKEKHRKFEGYDFSRKKSHGAVWNQVIGILDLCEMGYFIVPPIEKNIDNFVLT